jgi:hypothetical protein
MKPCEASSWPADACSRRAGSLPARSATPWNCREWQRTGQQRRPKTVMKKHEDVLVTVRSCRATWRAGCSSRLLATRLQNSPCLSQADHAPALISEHNHLSRALRLCLTLFADWVAIDPIAHLHSVPNPASLDWIRGPFFGQPAIPSSHLLVFRFRYDVLKYVLRMPVLQTVTMSQWLFESLEVPIQALTVAACGL